MKVAALVKSLDNVCARYRIAPFIPALRDASCAVTMLPIPGNLAARMLMFARLKSFDVVILQRRLFPSYEVKFLRRNSRRLIFDFDDAIFCHDSYDPRGVESKQRARRFRNLMGQVDGVIAGNDFLRDEAIIAGASAPSVRMIPTCVEPRDYTPAVPRRKEFLDLVWIGASGTLRSVVLQKQFFERVADRFPNLRLRMICDRFPDFARPPIVPIRWSLRTEAAELAAGDIGISRLPDDRWSRGKCGVKILQYCAAGLPVIANPVGVHSEMIESGVSGILADTDEAWFDAIDALADPSLRSRMGAEGRKSVERYSVAAHYQGFVEMITRG